MVCVILLSLGVLYDEALYDTVISGGGSGGNSTGSP